HGRDGTADIDPDERCLPGIERTARGENLIERQPLDEFHPQSDGPVVLVDAVYHHHARMPHAGEQAPFLDDRRRSVVRAENLQGNVTFEKRIPRQVQSAETTTADFAADLEPSPRLRNS